MDSEVDAVKHPRYLNSILQVLCEFTVRNLVLAALLEVVAKYAGSDSFEQRLALIQGVLILFLVLSHVIWKSAKLIEEKSKQSRYY